MMLKFTSILLFIVCSCSAQANVSGIKLSKASIEKGLAFSGQILEISGKKGRSDEVAILVLGPAKSYQVVLKEQKFGMWVNSGKHTISAISSFHHVASTKQILDITNESTLKLLRLKPGTNQCISKEEVGARYCDAFYANRITNGLYEKNADAISTTNGEFSASLRLPESSPVGLYSVLIYTFNTKGKLINTNYAYFIIRNGKIHEALSQFAKNYPLTHSILAITFALSFGSVIGLMFNGGRKKQPVN